MEIRIAANLVDTLRYRLVAQATIAGQGAVQVDVMPMVGGRGGKNPLSRPRRVTVADEIPVTLIASPTMKPAEVSAAIRALRERTYREVLAQIEHFSRTTGREWEIRRLDYGELLPRTAAGDEAAADAAQLTLVTHVELGASVRIVH